MAKSGGMDQFSNEDPEAVDKGKKPDVYGSMLSIGRLQTLGSSVMMGKVPSGDRGGEGSRYTRREVGKGEGPQPKAKGVFVDAGAMKDKMRAQLAKPEYDVRNFYKTEGWAANVARSPMFDKVSLSVIAFNALWISVDTDYNDASVLTEADWPFQVADHGFCAFFFTEWIIRFLAFKMKRNGLRDAWFCFDFLMVLMMVFETWVLTLIMSVADVGSGGMGNAGIFKLIRLTRLTRMARMARLLRAMPELLVLLKGMWAATRSVFFTLLLLFIIIYVFGIIFTQMTSGSEIGDEYFSTVPASMHTLLLRGTLMDEMTDIVADLVTGSPLYAVVFYVFLLISALTVMNMLIGVLCEVVAAVAATEKEESSVAYVKWQIRDIMRKGGLDLDGDGMISKQEFIKILDNAQATRTLSNAGVDVFGLVDCADFIFGEDQDRQSLISGGGQPVQLSFPDFMEVVLQLRGTNSATVKDLVDLRKFLTVRTKKLEHMVKKLGKDQASFHAWVSSRDREGHGGDGDNILAQTAAIAHWNSTKPVSHDYAYLAQTYDWASGKGGMPAFTGQVSPFSTDFAVGSGKGGASGLGAHASPKQESEQYLVGDIATERAPESRAGVAEQLPPQESCEITESLGVPQAQQVDAISTPAAITVPSVASAAASVGVALKSDIFDQINGELDQLRQYVDAELSAIMQDLRMVSRQPDIGRPAPLQNAHSNFAVKLPNVDASTPGLEQTMIDKHIALYDHEVLGAPDILPVRTGSSAMCPGAELRCLGADRRKQATCGL